MGSAFPTTRWTLVLQAGRGDDTPAREALSSLCESYWTPLYIFVRRSGVPESEAEDLVQAYFVELMDRCFLENLEPERGRFRAFLLHTIKHFISNHRKRAHAAKRGGRAIHLSLDAEEAERLYAASLATGLKPDQEFDRNWALSVVDRVLERLQSDAAKNGRATEFQKLRGFLTDGSMSGGYRQAATELGVQEGALRVAVHRLRQKFSKALREEIAETVNDPREVEQEIRYLFDALSR